MMGRKRMRGWKMLMADTSTQRSVWLWHEPEASDRELSQVKQAVFAVIGQNKQHIYSLYNIYSIYIIFVLK